MRLHGRRLTADHGDVVVETDMPCAVILAEQHALARKSLRQELGRRIILRGRTEGGVASFVFEDDDEDMADLFAVIGHGGRRCRKRAEQHRRGERPSNQVEHGCGSRMCLICRTERLFPETPAPAVLWSYSNVDAQAVSAKATALMFQHKGDLT